MLGSAESELTVILILNNPTCVITIHQRYRRTDRRTDDNTALCIASRSENVCDATEYVSSLIGLPFKVIDFGTNRKRTVGVNRPIMVMVLFDLNSNLGPILPCFRDIRAFDAESHFFDNPSLFRPKFQVVPLGVYWSMMSGSAECEHPRLCNREIICERFQPL